MVNINYGWLTSLRRLQSFQMTCYIPNGNMKSRVQLYFTRPGRSHLAYDDVIQKSVHKKQGLSE